MNETRIDRKEEIKAELTHFLDTYNKSFCVWTCLYFGIVVYIRDFVRLSLGMVEGSLALFESSLTWAAGSVWILLMLWFFRSIAEDRLKKMEENE